MIKLGLWTISFLLLTACGDSEPVSTTYKKSMGAAAGLPAASTGTPAGTAGTGDANAALVKQGQDLYVAKCAACHQALTAPSAKKGATAARITAAATIAAHATVKPFPAGAEVTALEAALK